MKLSERKRSSWPQANDNLRAVIDFTDPHRIWEERQKVQVVDLREPFAFGEAAVPGSRNLSLPQLLSGEARLSSTRAVIVLSSTDERSEMAALMLQVRGFNAHALSGGIERWRAARLPLEAGTVPAFAPDEVADEATGGAA